MLKRILTALALLILFSGPSLADEYKATIKKVDADKNSIVVSVNGEEKTFAVAKDAEIYTQLKGAKNKPGPKNPVAGGLSGLKENSEATITTIKSGEREIVSAIKLEPGIRKKPK